MEVGAGPVVCVVDSLAEPAARFVYSSGKNLYALQLAGGSHTVQRLMGLEAAPGDLYATDLNADGMLDIFVRRGRSGGQLADLVLEGQAGGGYSQTAVLPIRDTCASSTQSCSLDLAVVSGVAFCDINTDGTIDIIESNRILLQVDQLYTESPLRVQGLPRVQTTSAVVCMDMNGDALPDVFIGGVGVPDTVLINKPSADPASPSFEVSRCGDWGATLTTASVFDSDGDGIPELLVAKEDGRDVILNLPQFGSDNATQGVLRVVPLFQANPVVLQGRTLRLVQSTSTEAGTQSSVTAHVIGGSGRSSSGFIGVFVVPSPGMIVGFEVLLGGARFLELPEAIAGGLRTVRQEVAETCGHHFPVAECKYRMVVDDAFCGERCIPALHRSACCAKNPRCEQLSDSAPHTCAGYGDFSEEKQGMRCSLDTACKKTCCELDLTHDVCADLDHVDCSSLSCERAEHLCPLTCGKCLPFPDLPPNVFAIRASLPSVREGGVPYLSGDPQILFTSDHIKKDGSSFQWQTSEEQVGGRPFYASGSPLVVEFSTVGNEPLAGLAVDPFVEAETVPEEVALYGLSFDSRLSADPDDRAWVLLSRQHTSLTRASLSRLYFEVASPRAYRSYKVVMHGRSNSTVAAYSVVLFAKESLGVCGDTSGWHMFDTTETGETVTRSCADYAQKYCRDNVDLFVDLHPTDGSPLQEPQRNYPSDNCCLCGRTTARCARQHGKWQVPGAAGPGVGSSALQTLYALQKADATDCCEECIASPTCNSWDYDTALGLCRGVKSGVPSLPQRLLDGSSRDIVSGGTDVTFSGSPPSSCHELASRSDQPLSDGVYTLTSPHGEYTAHCDMSGGGWQLFLNYSHTSGSVSRVQGGADIHNAVGVGGTGHVDLDQLGLVDSSGDFGLAELRFYCRSSLSKVIHFATSAGGVLRAAYSWGNGSRVTQDSTTAGDWRNFVPLEGHSASLPAAITGGQSTLRMPFFSDEASYAMDRGHPHGAWACDAKLDSDTPHGNTSFLMYFKTAPARTRYNPSRWNVTTINAAGSNDSRDPHVACGGPTSLVRATEATQVHTISLNMQKHRDWGCVKLSCPAFQTLSVNFSCDGRDLAGRNPTVQFFTSVVTPDESVQTFSCDDLFVAPPLGESAVLRVSAGEVIPRETDYRVSVWHTCKTPTASLPPLLNQCFRPHINDNITGSGCWHLQCPSGSHVDLDWRESEPCSFSNLTIYAKQAGGWSTERTYSKCDTPSFRPTKWKLSEVLLWADTATSNVVKWRCTQTHYETCDAGSHDCDKGLGGLCAVVNGVIHCGCRKGYSLVNNQCRATCALHQCPPQHRGRSSVCPTSFCTDVDCCTEIPATPAPHTGAPPTPFHSLTQVPETAAPVQNTTKTTGAPSTPTSNAPDTDAPKTSTPATPPTTPATPPATAQKPVLDAVKAVATAATGKLASWQGDNFCVWGGVSCNAQGSVTALALDGAALDGEVPDLSGLADLRYLYVQETGITGFSKLPASLVEVDFSYAPVYGPFPAAVAELPNLRTVRAKGAGLTGPLPVFSPSVQHIDVHNNEMTGPVVLPPSILNFLGMGNGFEGALPASATVLRIIVNNNKLTGTLPAYPSLLMGHFHFNNLEGLYVPAVQTPKAWYVDLSHNSFAGPLPNFADTPMHVFKGHHNAFTGGFHLAAPGQRVMGRLSVNDNNLTGPEPTAAQAAAVAAIVKLYGNSWGAAMP